MKTTDTAHFSAREADGLEPPTDLKTPTDLSPNAVGAISAALRELLADVFALYVKQKISTST
jgi:hypothetical protein